MQHEQITTVDFLLLDIKHYWIQDEIYENGKIDPHHLNPMSRLAGHDYGSIGNILTIERPK